MSLPAAKPTDPQKRAGASFFRRAGDLNGLVGRDAFVRAVDQADRDRDRLMVAVITVDGLAEVNQLCGYDAGDRLLGALAGTLADRASVDLTAARIGGSQLGLLLTPLGDRQPSRLIESLLVDLRVAIDHWLDQRSALGTPSPIVPRPRIGVAAGYGAGTWADAELALAVAQGEPDGPASVHFDLADERLATHRRRQRLAEELVEALHRQRLSIDVLVAEPIDGGAAGDDGGDTWYRIVSRPARRPRRTPGREAWGDGLTADDLALAPGLATRLDGHLLATAADLLDGRWPGSAASPPSESESESEPSPSSESESSPESESAGRAVAVPVLGPLNALSSTLDQLAPSDPVAGAGVVVEVDQRHLLDLIAAEERMPARARTPAGTLAGQLDRLGWQVAIAGFDGGWAAWSLVERFPVHHLRPRPDLVLAAIDGEPNAARLLADGTTGPGPRFSVPVDASSAPGADAERLRRIGLTHIERPLSGRPSATRSAGTRR